MEKAETGAPGAQHVDPQTASTGSLDTATPESRPRSAACEEDDQGTYSGLMELGGLALFPVAFSCGRLQRALCSLLRAAPAR